MFKFVTTKIFKQINMDKGLEKMVKVFKKIFNLKEKDAERIKEQVSYLEYAFYDILESHKDEKISMDSLIIFFGYLFGTLIEDDYTFETFLAILKAVYLSNKIESSSQKDKL